uniref:Uncharacterized protein n=1 Tax=Rhizophora mucronata TaxID=61149 RepID=A0A2P2P620_RHIMU
MSMFSISHSFVHCFLCSCFAMLPTQSEKANQYMMVIP